MGAKGGHRADSAKREGAELERRGRPPPHTSHPGRHPTGLLPGLSTGRRAGAPPSHTMPPTGASATGRKRPAPADAPAPPAKVAATKSVGSKAHPARATRSAAPPRAAPKRRAPRRAALRGPVERAAEPGKVADKGATAGRAMGGVPGRGRRARRAPATRKDAGGGRGARPAAAALPPPMTAVHLNTFIATDIASIAPPTHPTPLPSATTPLAASPRAVPDPTPAPLAKTNADSADSAADAVPTSPLAPAPTARAPLDSGWFDPADPAKVALVRRALQGDFLAPPPGHAPVARATEARALDAAVAACLASGRGGVVYFHFVMKQINQIIC